MKQMYPEDVDWQKVFCHISDAMFEFPMEARDCPFFKFLDVLEHWSDFIVNSLGK